MTPDQSKLLFEEVAKLNPSPVIELYELDTRPCGDTGEVLYFHNGTGGFTVSVAFKGQAYQPLPIRVTGFELSGSGEPPRPTLSIMNAGGFMSAIVLRMADLVGAKLIRRRTFARFLDGEPESAPVEYPIDEFTIVQKTREDRLMVEFELGSGLDLDGVRFPPRTIQSQYCQHPAYRGSGCRFSGQYVVSGDGLLPADGMLAFKGSWEPSVRYRLGDTVWFTASGVSGVYRSISSSELIGYAASPNDPALWTRIQRFRGEFSATVNDYVVNDVVYIVTNTGSQFFICIRNVPTGTRPPSAVYWRRDECHKSLVHCRWRFDPMKINQTPLPFGGFPGTLTIPEV